MLFLGSANAETLDAWKAHYRHKLALLAVLYLVLPVAKEEQLPTLSAITSSVHPTTLHLAQQQQLASSVHSVTLDSRPFDPVESPLTAAYIKPASGSGSGEELQGVGDREGGASVQVMPVKGSTSRDVNSSTGWSATPPISSPPPKPERSGHAVASVQAGDDHVERQWSAETEYIEEQAAGAESDVASFVDADAEPPSPNPRLPRPSPLPLDHSSELADAFEEFSLFLISSIADALTALLAWRPTSFHLFAFLIHILAFVHLVSLLVEDSIVRTTMSDPLPRDLGRGSTWGKRVSRWRWRAGQLTKRYKGAMGLLVVCSVVCAWVGWEAVMVPNSETGWNDVPGARWVSGLVTESVEGEVRRCPFRLLIAIETLGTSLSLLQSIKHFLPTSILPPTLPPPALLFPGVTTPPFQAHTPAYFSPSRSPSTSPASSAPHTPLSSPTVGPSLSLGKHPSTPPLALDTHWLLQNLDTLLQAFLSLFQFALLLPLLPRTRYSLLHPASHILFHSIRGRVLAIGQARDRMRRTVECLRVVFEEFPEEGKEGKGKAVALDEQEGADDEEWVCTICFEGLEEEELAPAPSPSSSTANLLATAAVSPSSGAQHSSTPKRTTKARCRLPCGHRYHAGCLSTWLQYQSWCPSCHDTIAGGRNAASNTPAAAAAPFFEPSAEAEVDTSDEYPGTRRRAAAGGVREED